MTTFVLSNFYCLLAKLLLVAQEVTPAYSWLYLCLSHPALPQFPCFLYFLLNSYPYTSDFVNSAVHMKRSLNSCGCWGGAKREAKAHQLFSWRRKVKDFPFRTTRLFLLNESGHCSTGFIPFKVTEVNYTFSIFWKLLQTWNDDISSIQLNTTIQTCFTALHQQKAVVFIWGRDLLRSLWLGKYHSSLTCQPEIAHPLSTCFFETNI